MSADGTALYRAAKVEQFQTGDATLPLRRFGSGPPLLLVHGFPLHGFTWRKLLPLLAPHYTCYMPDLAGLGASQWTERTDFTFEGHARRLRALADALQLADYRVISQDTGATVARHLALMDGARVKQLVMVNTEIPGHRPPWIVPYQYAMKLPGSQFFFRLLLRSRAFLRSPMGFGGCFGNPDLIDGEFREQFAERYVRDARATDGMARYLVGCKWPSVDCLAQRHAEIRAPVLLVWGEDDPTFPIERARAMLPQFRDCQLVSIPGAKLLVYEEKPQEVAEAVLRFFAAGAA